MRITSDKKDSTLKLRLNEDMRNYIEKSASKRGQSMSEYVRDLICRDMEKRF